MTEERKIFLASISKEERVIRTEIYKHKEFIKSVKEVLDEIDDNAIISSFKEDIAKEKTIIRVLKKQLPAPTKEPILYHCACPKCGFFVDGENDKYCYECGQKLR